MKTIRNFQKFPRPRRRDIEEYVDDTGADWGPDGSIFIRKRVYIHALENALTRELRIQDIDMSMAGKSRTPGPLILDRDLSVIDGMHRLATAVRDGKTMILAWVRL